MAVDFRRAVEREDRDEFRALLNAILAARSDAV
jgi:hypothetical protein